MFNVIVAILLTILPGFVNGLWTMPGSENLFHRKSSPDAFVFDGKPHSFTVKEDQFFWDDADPVLVQAGELHYFRIPSMYWEDRMARMQALGFNTISTYVPWNFHQVDESSFDFSSERHDLLVFLQVAMKMNLAVVLRPGPYICADWTGGGLPSWLMEKKGIQVRTYDPQYIAAVDTWWNWLLSHVSQYMVYNGGNVIMVQLENEFGMIGDTANKWKDRKYIEHLRDTAVKLLGKKAVLFTADPMLEGRTYLARGGIDGVLRTVNLESQIIVNDLHWKTLQTQWKTMNPSGKNPLYIAEVYSGGFTKMSDKMLLKTPTSQLEKGLQRLVNRGISFGVYMAVGGTNFEFTAGANDGTFTTSYDYNAPISEGGGHGIGSDGKDKFTAVQNVLKQGRVLLDEPPLPLLLSTTFPMKRIGVLHLEFDELCHNDWRKISGPEAYQGQGLAVYRYTQLKSTREFDGQHHPLPKPLTMSLSEKPTSKRQRHLNLQATDDSSVWFNGEYVGRRCIGKSCPPHSEQYKDHDLKIPAAGLKKSQAWTLDVLVDLPGRRTFAMKREDLIDRRGLVNAELDGKPLSSNEDGQWSICELRFTSEGAAQYLREASSPNEIHEGQGGLHEESPHGGAYDELEEDYDGPAFWAGAFQVSGEHHADAFMHFGEGWQQGIVFINGKLLGRYNTAAPQKDFYLPGSLMTEADTNSVLILETGISGVKRRAMGPISFVTNRISVDEAEI